MKSFGIIIPARYASTRLPGKPLADINGKSLIQRVVENASSITQADFILVATDDNRIFNHVNTFGNALMTKPDHPTGTDRIRECLDQLKVKPEVIVNIQGDEPFLDPDLILNLVSCFDNSDCQIATAYHNVTEDEAGSPHTVKLVTDLQGKALYFSRSKIPFPKTADAQYKSHMGVYAYKSEILQEITELSPSSLEVSESLEQLRWMENGYSIYCIESALPSIGIDTEDDLQKARQKTF